MSEEINYDRPIAKVSFDLPFCLYVNDDDYDVQMLSYTATMGMKRSRHEQIDPRLGIEEASAIELSRDRYGRLHYTSVEVRLPGQIVVERAVKKKIKEKIIEPEGSVIKISVDVGDLVLNYSEAALEEAIAVANYVVTVYREVTKAFYIRTFSKLDVYRATINWFTSEQLLGGNEYMKFGRGIKLQPKGLLPEIGQQFRERLKVYRLPPIHSELHMNARDYLDLGEYRMAVIESRTALEVIVDQVLKTYFITQKVNIEEFRRLLEVGKRRDIQTIHDILQQAWINKKLVNGLKSALGKGLNEDAVLWERWLEAKDNRERAVHQASDISEIEANESVDVIGTIIDFILRKLENHSLK